MSTNFNWFARLTDANGKPAVDVRVQVQLFYIHSNAWIEAGAAKSGTNGELRGKGVIADDTVPLAPALRLVEDGGAAVLSASPRFSRRSGSSLLNVDFGELIRLPDTARFIQPRAATRGIPDDPIMVAAVLRSPNGPLLATEKAVIEAEAVKTVSDEFAARLEASAKVLAEREKVLVETTARLARSEATLAQLKTTANLGEGETSVSVGDLATKLGTELDGAQTALKSSGFSLGTITVNARGLIQGDGSRLNLLQTADLKALPAGVLSDVKIDLSPDPPSSSATGLVVPDVGQLTEAAARRVLASVGLKLEASSGPTGLDADVAEGQAMLQTPEAGTTIARGGRILVVFARDAGVQG